MYDAISPRYLTAFFTTSISTLPQLAEYHPDFAYSRFSRAFRKEGLLYSLRKHRIMCHFGLNRPPLLNIIIMVSPAEPPGARYVHTVL